MWEKVKLHKVIYKPISGEWGNEGDSIKIIRTTNFTNSGRLHLHEVVTRDIDLTKVNKKKLVKGDTIIEKSGGSPTQPVGRVVYFNEDDLYLCNNFTSVIRPKENVNGKYLFWFLFNNHVSKRTLRYQNKTTGIINLKLENYINEIEIPLPPLPIQEKIATILDKADELRRKDKDLQTKYDELAQAIFIDMFGDPVKNEKGWEVKNIEQLTTKEKHSIKRGPFGGALKKEIFVESGYLIYEQYHALNNDFSMERYFIDEEKYKELIAFKVLPKDIIISCSGVYLGKLAVVPDNAKKGIINQALLKIRLNEQVVRNDFFVFHFSQKNFREKYFDANRGAGIPNFPPMSEFKRFPFICPPLSLQEAFARKIELINQLKVQTNAEKSEELFQSLLQKAFKGELVS